MTSDPFSNRGQTIPQRLEGLTFRSNAVAFEYDTIAASRVSYPNVPNGATPLVLPPVPEPAAWTLMIAGFALTGLAARRRRITVTA